MRIVIRGFCDVLFCRFDDFVLLMWKELGSKRKKGEKVQIGRIRPVQCGQRVVDSRSGICCGMASSSLCVTVAT